MTSGTRFLRGYTTAVSRNCVRRWRTPFHQASMLIVDDIEGLAGRRSTEEVLVRLVDQFVADNRPVVITSAVHPATSTDLSPRLASRLCHGLAAPLCGPGFLARCQILHQLARSRGIDFSRTAIAMAANHLESTVPKLDQFLRLVVSTNGSQVSSIETTDVRRALAQSDAEGHVLPETIIRSVARHYQFPIAQLTGRSRRHSLARARAVAIYLIRKMASPSLKQIGQYFGGRDHSTVLHAYRTAESLVKHDSATRQAVSELRRSLEAAGKK
jgi:chromosomal replication initiator protein